MLYDSWIMHKTKIEDQFQGDTVQKSYLINISADPLYCLQGGPHQLLIRPVLLPNLIRVHVRQVLVIWKLGIRVRFRIRNKLGIRIELQSRPSVPRQSRIRNRDQGSHSSTRNRSIPTDNSDIPVELLLLDLNDFIINGNQPVLILDHETSRRRLGPLRNLQFFLLDTDLRLVTPPLEIPDFSGQLGDTTSKANLKQEGLE
ncbi:hypothetical protein BJ322DRAFT_1025585 [Thelephora terrestris]|uniref:Uncharacterized protein n=1 Tax=Thelephora terrestris TaxID=56493 RepID=A0A9P6H2E6_9AGAM|nr:hypothetical protein BJ322DRAFT_1025585 [Thelephora terrestris]